MLISIVVPVHDPPADRLAAAIRSVMQQEYCDWELIVVNDGSKDAHVLRHLAKLRNSHRRVLVEDQPNQGPGEARNRGVELASGEYVTFLDSDDELAPYALSEAVRVVRATDCDIAMGWLQRVRSETQRRPCIDRGSLQVFQGEGIKPLIEFTLAGRGRCDFFGTPQLGLKNGPVARFVRISLAREVPFLRSLSVGEDTVWNLDVLARARTVAVSRSVLYWYWVNHASTSRGFRQDAVSQAREFFKHIEARREWLGICRLPDDLLVMRIVNEVDRVNRTYYSRREADLRWTERLRGGRRLLREGLAKKAVGARTLYRASRREWTFAPKYVLCATGLGPVAWRLREWPLSRRGRSVNAGNPNE